MQNIQLYPLLSSIDNFGGAELLQNASNDSKRIAESFNNLWQTTIGGSGNAPGSIYGAMCTVGVLFAAATLTLFMVQWGKQMIDGDYQRALPELIWPLVVIALLFNKGTLLANSTVTLKDYINITNNNVLKYASSGLDLRAAYKQASGNAMAQADIRYEIAKCESGGGVKTTNSEESTKCKLDAVQRMSKKYPWYFMDFRSDNPILGAAGQWFRSSDRVLSAVGETKDDNILAAGVKKIFAIPGAVGGVVFEAAASTILLSLNSAYQWGLEFTLLLTALLGPIAVGASLMPYGTKPIVAWLTGFITVGMAKLCFNIITGFCGQLITTADAEQPMIFLLFVGLIAPFLATGLAAGGGLALFNEIGRGAQFVANGTVDLTVKVVKVAAGGG